MKLYISRDPYNDISIQDHDDADFIFKPNFTEFPGCCGVHVISGFPISRRLCKPPERLKQAFKLYVQEISSSFRLCYITHTTTEGEIILEAAREIGFKLDHVVVSNHRDEHGGEIHVMSIEGTKPDPEEDEENY